MFIIQKDDSEDEIKCLCCSGWGKVYIGHRDPYEGNKLRDRIDCKVCHGRKTIPIKTPLGQAMLAFWAKLTEEEEKERKEQEEKERQRKYLQAKALSKLSPEEIEALGLKLELE